MGQNTDTKTSILSKFVHSASRAASDMALSLEKDETIEVLKHGLTHVVAHDRSQGPLIAQCEEIAKYLYEHLRSAAVSKAKPAISRSGKSGKPNWRKWNQKRAKEAGEKEPPAVKDVETSKEPDEKVKTRPAVKNVQNLSKERREKVKAKAAVKDVKNRSKEPDEMVKRKKKRLPSIGDSNLHASSRPPGPGDCQGQWLP